MGINRIVTKSSIFSTKATANPLSWGMRRPAKNPPNHAIQLAPSVKEG
jgi:hypothetical protein